MSDNSIQLVNSAANADTFGSWISKTNQLINALAQEVVTANSLPGGSLTTGNAFVNGVFSADTLTANGALRGGNVTVGNTLAVTSNVSIGNSTSNVVITFSTVNVGTVTVNTSAVTVGSNVVVNATALDIGNSTVYSFMNSSVHTVATRVEVGIGTPNSVLNSTALAIGNSTVFSTVNATVANVPLFTTSNAYVNSTSLGVGNSTVNAFANSTVISLSGVNTALVTNRDSVALANTLVGTRGRINFIAGNNVTLSVTDDSAGGQVNVTINSTAAGGISSPGGANTQVQYNDSGFLNATAAFTFDETTNTVALSNTLTLGANVLVNTVALSMGNSTVNALANSVIVTVASASGRANLQPTALTVATAVVNTTGFFVGANASVNSSVVFVGNSTVSAFTNSTLMQVATATASANHSAAGFAHGVMLANGSGLYFGSVAAARDVTPATVGYAASITLDLSTLVNGKLTLTGATTLAAPTNANAGWEGVLEILQDGTGSRTMAFNSAWKFAGGVVPTLTTTAGARDLLAYKVLTGGASPVVYATLVRDVK